MQRLAAGGEWHRGELDGSWVSLVHEGQQAVMMNLNLSLLQGCHYHLFHLRLTEAQHAGLRSSEDHMDPMSLDTKFLQRLHSGENINAVAIDDGVI